LTRQWKTSVYQPHQHPIERIRGRGGRTRVISTVETTAGYQELAVALLRLMKWVTSLSAVAGIREPTVVVRLRAEVLPPKERTDTRVVVVISQKQLRYLPSSLSAWTTRRQRASLTDVCLRGCDPLLRLRNLSIRIPAFASSVGLLN